MSACAVAWVASTCIAESASAERAFRLTLDSESRVASAQRAIFFIITKANEPGETAVIGKLPSGAVRTVTKVPARAARARRRRNEGQSYYSVAFFCSGYFADYMSSVP